MKGLAAGSVHGANERRVLPSDFIVFPEKSFSKAAVPTIGI
jgi:hypothetical protein